ncbi:MAG: aromatic ring-hydroxylating dioxygenase subunit alpha [Pseudomonadales bacterium]|nr:aromatic ring-hydroxylating dioxygenase subunit alpha [Pseudomonadales bacterium]
MNGAGSALAELLEGLSRQAALPGDRARSLPPAFYWRPDVWTLEQERIFRGEWLCVAHVDQLRKPGDWRAVEIAGEPLVVTRDRAGELHALSRICRHRNMDLLHGAAERSGHGSFLQCPYHLWAYELDGRLRGAPMMEGSHAFDRAACGLPRFPLETWQGYVFVCLDAAAAPLAPRLAPIEQVLGGLDMRDWQIAGAVDWGDAPVNWKVAFENYAEFYHHIGTHRESLQPLWPAARIALEATDSDAVFIGRMRVNPDVATGTVDGYPVQPTVLPPIAGLTPEQRSQTVVYGLFPLFGIVVGPESALWFEWTPTGPERHRTVIHVLVPPASRAAPGFEQGLEVLMHGVRAVQAEDAAANAAVQVTARSPFASSGPLAPIESTLLQFQRYLARRLTA